MPCTLIRRNAGQIGASNKATLWVLMRSRQSLFRLRKRCVFRVNNRYISPIFRRWDISMCGTIDAVESVVVRLDTAFKNVGFRVNQSKSKILAGEPLLEAISQMRHKGTTFYFFTYWCGSYCQPLNAYRTILQPCLQSALVNCDEAVRAALGAVVGQELPLSRCTRDNKHLFIVL
eukprot:1491352-Amphidinium_carterae.3